jgi:hypothetical protein
MFGARYTIYYLIGAGERRRTCSRVGSRVTYLGGVGSFGGGVAMSTLTGTLTLLAATSKDCKVDWVPDSHAHRFVSLDC